MMRLVFGTLAAAAIVGLSFVQPAEARCFFNGFETVCTHHFGYGHHFSRGYERPYWWGGY